MRLNHSYAVVAWVHNRLIAQPLIDPHTLCGFVRIYSEPTVNGPLKCFNPSKKDGTTTRPSRLVSVRAGVAA